MTTPFKYNIQRSVEPAEHQNLLAPILAIVLALSLAGAINSSMLPTDSSIHVQPTPQPSSPHSTRQPMAAGPMGSSNSFILFVVGAVLIGMAAFLLFFREKKLTKELNK